MATEESNPDIYTLHWVFNKDVGYYVWTAINDEHKRIFTNKTRCFEALEWCDRHNIKISNVDDLGTRR